MQRDGLAVAPGAARLLGVGFERARGLQVDEEADVGLVHAHAEGDGGDDDAHIAVHEAAHAVGAVLGAEAGVVGERDVGVGAPLLQFAVDQRGHLLAAIARGDVDDAGALLLAADVDDRAQLLLFVRDALHFVEEVRAEEADAHAAEVAAEPVGDLFGDLGRRGRGEGQDGRLAERGEDLRHDQVVGAEVVAPEADAVRLVDHEQRDLGRAPARAGTGPDAIARARRRRGCTRRARSPRSAAGSPPRRSRC